jgi:hypothetical protein
MNLLRKENNTALRDSVALIQAMESMIEKGVITIDIKARTAKIHDQLWELNKEKARKNYAENIAIYVSGLSDSPNKVSVEIFSMQTGKLIASFTNDKAWLF